MGTCYYRSRSNIVHVTVLDKRDSSDNKWWRLYHHHYHLSSSSCTSSSDWYYTKVTNEGTYVYHSNVGNDYESFIDHYHGIATSRVSTNAREAYTTWTDSRLYNNNQDYNMFYDRLSSNS